MAKIRDDDLLIPSVLDRLIDDGDTGHDVSRSRAQKLRDLKKSVRRDLENLLNTRWRCSIWPPDMDELETSLVNYGVPDFSGVNMSLTVSREELREIIEQVIRRFEPRFKEVRVKLKDVDRTERTLQFQIDGLLHAEPAPEPVVYDSEIKPTTAVVQIEE